MATRHDYEQKMREVGPLGGVYYVPKGETLDTEKQIWGPTVVNVDDEGVTFTNRYLDVAPDDQEGIGVDDFKPDLRSGTRTVRFEDVERFENYFFGP